MKGRVFPIVLLRESTRLVQVFGVFSKGGFKLCSSTDIFSFFL